MKASLSIFNSKICRFFIKMAIFLLILIVIDWSLGTVIERLHKSAPYGVNWTKENWLLSESFDIVIFGSSRAFRHYIPKVISKELNLTVFNAGQNGQYMLYAYALEQLLLDKHVPKIIVLDVLPSYIVRLENPDQEFERLSSLSPFIHNKEVKKLLTRGQFYESLKYGSKLFRYNSKILSILDNLQSGSGQYDNGYEIIGDAPFREKNPFIVDTMGNVVLDIFKLDILSKFIQSAQDKQILVLGCFSPVSQPLSSNCQKTLDIFQDVFAQQNAPFFNFADSSYFWFQNRDYFMDTIHMDGPGATLFSKEFAKKLQLQLLSRPPL